MPLRPGLDGISQVREPKPAPSRTDTHCTNLMSDRISKGRFRSHRSRSYAAEARSGWGLPGRRAETCPYAD